MSFLTPLVFLGLAAIAVPILVHLIQKERSTLIQFPSLMFVRRIPYQSVRRRKLRHWFLLSLRIAAIALIVLAFARPFFSQGAMAVAAAGGGSREIVVLLDNSASMGYGDHWQRAQDAARDAVGSLGVTDRASLVLFGRNADEQLRSASDRDRFEAAVGAARVSSNGTRYGPALKLAESILERSNLPRREVILISDMQRTGWTGSEDVRFAENVQLQLVPITSDDTANVSVPSITFGRAEFSGQERITLTAGVTSRGQAASNVPVTLEVDGRVVETQNVSIAANSSASVQFQPFTLASTTARGVVKAGTDALQADNAFHFVLAPSRPVSVLVVDQGDDPLATFYLTRALAVGTTPAFQVETMPPVRVAPASIERRSIVVLNNTPIPPGVGMAGLRTFVEQGGGLLVVAGERTAWPSNDTSLMPGQIGGLMDRMSGQAGTIGFRDYSHPIFEVFKAPRSGDFTTADIYRYRSLQTGPEDRILARYDDGAVAMAERRVGTGRVIVVTTSLDDSWNTLAKRPIYLPVVHQTMRYLARYEPPSEWRSVGQVVDLSALLQERVDRVVVAPSSEQTKLTADNGMLELGEQGIYEIRSAGSNEPLPIAANLDPAEADLTQLDTTELSAAVTGRAAGEQVVQPAAAEITPLESERQQNLWWYLLVAGLMILAAEMALSNRYSRTERFL